MPFLCGGVIKHSFSFIIFVILFISSGEEVPKKKKKKKKHMDASGDASILETTQESIGKTRYWR